MMVDGNFKLLVLYARRPKVYDTNNEHISAKINTRLFERRKYFKNYNIPLIAGVLLVNNFSKIQINSKCAWLEIGDQGYDEIFLIKSKLESKVELPTIKQLSPQEIIHLIDQKKQKYEWKEIVTIIKNVQYSDNYR